MLTSCCSIAKKAFSLQNQTNILFRTIKLHRSLWPSARHQFTLPEHIHEARASRGVPTYIKYFAICHPEGMARLSDH